MDKMTRFPPMATIVKVTGLTFSALTLLLGFLALKGEMGFLPCILTLQVANLSVLYLNSVRKATSTQTKS